jgi:DNA-binding CsgD family transcriptional regulator
MDKNLSPIVSTLKRIEDQLAKAGSLHEGLNLLKDYLKPKGVAELTYGFMLHAKSHLRGDYLLYTTFPKAIRLVGMQDGGAITYRFGDLTPKMSEPLFFDMKDTVEGRGPLYSFNKTFKMIYETGYRHAWIIPFLREVKNGYGFLIMFQDNKVGAPKLDVNQLKEFGPLYHNTMIRCKQMAKQFKLTSKQTEALASAAKGSTAGDFATGLGLSERCIELRLQEARKKLRARTTTEAAYKALAYGILPNCSVDK